MRNDYHVAHSEGAWRVKLAGRQVGNNFTTQTAAADHARNLAHADWNSRGVQAQVHVHRPNGVIRTEWTYGNDPPEYPG